MSNRVEELEATVNELESTINGLTEELVEAKERIRELEAELESDPSSTAPSMDRAPSGDSDHVGREEFEEMKAKMEQAVDGPAAPGREAAPEEVEAATAAADEVVDSASEPVDTAKEPETEIPDEADDHEREGDIIIA